jgi:DNA-binding response OmpR family regulator
LESNQDKRYSDAHGVRRCVKQEGVALFDHVTHAHPHHFVPDGLGTTIAFHGLELRLGVGRTEFRLLRFLMSCPDRVMTRQALLDGVWGDPVYIEERTVDVLVRRLPVALEPSGHDALVETAETVRGADYRLRRSMK